RHPGREVAARFAQHEHPTAGHVFATMVAHTLDDRFHARVTHAETLSRAAPDIGLAAGGPVEEHVAHDDVLFRHEGRSLRGIDHDLAPAEALAHVIVGVPFEAHRHTLGHEGGEAVPRRALEGDLDGVVRQALGAIFAGDLGPHDGADRAVDVADGHFEAHR